MQLQINGFTYTVVPVEAVSDSTNPSAYGYANPVKREIEIRVDQSVDTAYETLAHEYVHAAEDAGLDLCRKDPEKRASAAASILCQFARQYVQQGGDVALAKVIGIIFPAAAIEAAHPEIDWLALEGPEMYSTVYRLVLCRGLTDLEFTVYRADVEASGLNPFHGECYPQRDRDGTVRVGAKLRGVRRLCREFGAKTLSYEWCGSDAVWKDVWLAAWGDPAAARCPIIDPEGQLLYGVAQFEAYCEYDVFEKQRIPKPWWARMGYHLLAQSAERLAVARVVPAISNVVVAPEMQYRFVKRVASRPVAARQVEDQRPADDEVPAQVGEISSMEDLRAAMSRHGVGIPIVQDAHIAKVRKLRPTLEGDDPDAFYAAVMGELVKAAGR